MPHVFSKIPNSVGSAGSHYTTHNFMSWDCTAVKSLKRYHNDTNASLTYVSTGVHWFEGYERSDEPKVASIGNADHVHDHTIGYP